MCVKNYPNATFIGPHQNPMPLHHVYKEEGRYLISALAIDMRVSYKRMLQVVIASLPCNMPEVEIVDKIMFYDKPQVNWRSLSIVKLTKAKIECTHPVPVSRWWTIVEVDKRTGEPQREIQVENVLTSWNFSQLDITPLFLELGVYKLTYWIRLDASKIFPLERADYTYVEIIPSPLQAVIIGGSVTSVSRGFGQSLVLNPQGLSVDPDDPKDKTFNVTWWCRQVEPQSENYETDNSSRILVYNKHPVSASQSSEIMNGGGCFGKSPGTLEIYGGYLELDTSSFVEPNAVYEIKVRISKDTRESYAGVEVTITQHPPPNIQIKCIDEKLCWPYKGGLLINPSFRLALLGSCISDCSSNMNFSWSITDLKKGSLDESPSGFLTSKMEKDLAVTPEFFSNNLAVNQFLFRLTVETERLSKGFAEIMVILNSPPSSGKCALTEDTVLALVGYSSAYCLDWLDPEDMGIVSYAFYYPDGNTEKTMVASGFSTVDLIFPVGYFQVWCRIQDKFGSYTDVFVGNVSSKMITEEKFQTYNASATLQYLASVGNQEKLGMVLVAIASIRENADWLSLESKVFTNMTDEIFERLDDVTVMNKESLEFASQTMDFATLPQLIAGVGVLKSTACGILTQETAAYTIDMEFREDSLKFMDKMFLKLKHVTIHSPYELQPFVTSCLDACVCLLKSMNIILENPEMSSVGDLKKAPYWDYETFIPENDIGFAVPLDRKTQFKQNVLETIRRRAKFVVKKLFDSIDNLGSHILTKSVVGELINEKSESGATIFVSKVTEESLKSGLEINLNDGLNSSVRLPESFCPSHYNDKDSNCKNVIGLTVVLWPCITHIYPSSHNLLTRTTTVLDIKVYINDKIINVINETNPIIMGISRKYEPLPKPVFVEGKKAISNHVPFVYHSFNISNTDSAFTVEFTPTGDLPPHLVILMDHKRLPTPSQYSKILTVNKLPVNENRTYTWFLNSMENENRTGKIYLAIALLKDGINVSDIHVNRTLKNEDFIKEFDQDYELSVITSGCYFYDSVRDHWSGSGLKCVGATPTHTYCEAKHLTPFGSGYFPVPNTVDFEYVFADNGFIDNLMIYLVMIITFSCYIIMLIWARFMDKKDIKYTGVTPLDDNNVEDKYLYEITFTTGPDKEAGTNSNIQFIASGEYDETDVRNLPSSEGRRYHRYSVDAFVMSTRGPLGFINYLRIWHDNSGNPPFDNWQLQTVIVRDLQTRVKYIFEANTWLAFDRGDTAVDVLLRPSEGEFNSRFSRDFYNKINRNANDDHMWMSIFLRPIGSRFSRKERVSVGALFLYLSMLFSAVWYETLSDSPRSGIIEFGLFTLSFEQAVIGVISGAIAYFVILILVFVFKRARPHTLKKCRALEAIVKQWKYQQKDKGLQIDKDEILNNYDTLSPQSSSNPSKEQSSVMCIPWWTRWLAWLLVMTGIFVSMFFVWSYGITWGEIKTVKWFSSFITSFFISLLFTQWLKVLFVTSVNVLCCKKIDSFFEDIDCDEELPELRYDEEWKNAQPMHPFTRRKVHRIRGVDSKKPEVAAIATRLTKEREMGFVIRDVVAYCFFLTVLYILVNGRMDYNAFLLQSHMTNAFIKIGHKDLDFSSKIITADHFWRWAQNVILQEIRAQRWYNNEPPYGLRGFLEDRDNRIMGYGILRQIRSDPRTCKVIKPLNQLINSCSGRREIDREDTRNFCDGWPFEEKFPGECHYDEFRYRSAAQLETYPLQGKLGSYSGGGYVIRLNGRQNDDLEKLRTLQEMGWIDKHTRAVMLEFSTFNANVNLFMTGTVIAEFNEGGGITPKWRFEPVRLLSHSGGFGFIILICECIFVIATFLFTLWESWKIKKMKCEYFASYWNITEICILVTSYITIGIYVYRYFLTKEAIKKFNNTCGNGYVRFDSAFLMDKIYFNLIAIIVFFSTLKLIKLLQFNKRMDVLALTIRLCWNELSVFFIAFGIVFFAFCCLFYFVFIAALEEFARFITAIETSFKMMLGKFDFEAMNQANPLSPVLFFVFSVMNSMILINIMLTIILKAFHEVKIDLECRKNKYDLIDFVWSSVRQALNLEKAPNNTVTPDVLDIERKKNSLTYLNAEDLTDKLPGASLSGMLCPVLVTLLEERYRWNGGSTEASYQDDSQPEKLNLRELNRTTEFTQDKWWNRLLEDRSVLRPQEEVSKTVLFRRVSELMTYVNDVYFDGLLNLNDPEALKHIM
ncbi:polycystin family receptor for egg jelly-like [Panulirus ornatus]|uniref:polycystin family receptor for egg jelly-like n=1 Tax=Panulirus ornatus TaxID=150431 RepID=UPI003A8A6752